MEKITQLKIFRSQVFFLGNRGGTEKGVTGQLCSHDRITSTMVVTRSAAGKRVLRDISNQVDHQARQTTYAGKLLPTVASPGKADSKNDLLDLIDCLAEINLSPTRPTSHTEVEKATDWLAQVSLSPKQTTKDESAFETLVCELDCALDELKLLGFQNYNNMVQQSTKALGSGKSGTVYEASLCTGPIVAVKTFTLNEKPADSPEDQTAAEYFRQQLGFFVEEAKMGFSACARGRANKKTNICQTLGVLRSDAQDGKVRASIVLEKVEGIDLVDFMSQPKYWRKSQYVGTGRYFIRQEEDDALYEYTLPRHEKLAIAYEVTPAVSMPYPLHATAATYKPSHGCSSSHQRLPSLTDMAFCTATSSPKTRCSRSPHPHATLPPPSRSSSSTSGCRSALGAPTASPRERLAMKRRKPRTLGRSAPSQTSTASGRRSASSGQGRRSGCMMRRRRLGSVSASQSSVKRARQRARSSSCTGKVRTDAAFSVLVLFAVQVGAQCDADDTDGADTNWRVLLLVVLVLAQASTARTWRSCWMRIGAWACWWRGVLQRSQSIARPLLS